MWKIVLLAMCGWLMAGCAMGAPPATVGHVDLQRYAGTWYEVARIPQWFEWGCVDATANYVPREDGRITVINRCHKWKPDGKMKEVYGMARVADTATNAKLKVRFKGPFEGDYWIFRLNDDYTTAAVGSPDRGALWILHRQPTIAPAEYEDLVASLKRDGFPVERLERGWVEGAATRPAP